ncbi:cyclase family protein [Gemmatimonas sp.]|uniref:cyclase family protein n=1 Tax=Gemmatimonas sp. TaxID=1962908 RepID=UPI003982E670
MFYDISIPFSVSTPPWPDDVGFSCGWTCRRENGSSVNLGVLSTSAHVGTHADAPLHVQSSWPASESLPASVFVGEVQFVALPAHFDAARDITIPLLQSLLGAHVPSRVIVRTGHSVAAGVFPDTWPALTADAATWLVQHGLTLWGVDAPSVDRRSSTELPVHHVIFGGGAFVLENLALDRVPVGRYELLAQPLAVHGADAAPVRALLRAVRDT